MATPVPNKYYKRIGGGTWGPSQNYLIGNGPFNNPDYVEISLQEYKSGNPSYVPPAESGYVYDDRGVYMSTDTLKAIDQQKADLASGKIIQTGTMNGNPIYAQAGSQTANQFLETGSPVFPSVASMTNEQKIANGVPVISLDSLKTGDDIRLGASQSDTDFAASMVAGVKAGSKSLQDYINQLTPNQTPTEQKQLSFLDQIASLTGELGQKGADQLSAEQNAAIPQLKAQFADINGQIATKTAEYDVLVQANQNKPITMNSIIGSERAILNAKAADIGLLQARAQALQGQLTTAQETVNRAIDLKYSTIEARIKTYQAQLNAILPILDKEETIQADARQRMINDQQQAIAEQKASEKEIQAMANEAASKGDANMSQAISNSANVEDARNLFAQFNASQIKQGTQDELALKGYNYVATPAERDRLKAQGYEIIQQGGRTYAKSPFSGGDMDKLLTPTEAAKLGVPYGTTRGDAANMNINPTPKPTPEEDPKKQIETRLKEVMGGDGYVSPDDYNAAKIDWLRAGGSEASFNSKMTYLRNPSNHNYGLKGSNSNTQTP